MNKRRYIKFPQGRYLIPLLGVLALVALVGTPVIAIADDDEGEVELKDHFDISVDLGNAGDVCQTDFSNARGKIELKEEDGTTDIEIEVKNAGPNLFYTAWIGLGSANASPLTNAGATPLAATTELDQLAGSTPPNPGSTDLVNGFFTEEDGEGELEVTLDFPLSGGVYPFPGPGNAKNIAHPTFTIRLASHCTDGVGHGLLPGVHEKILDWTIPEVVDGGGDDDDGGGDDDDDEDGHDDDDD